MPRHSPHLKNAVCYKKRNNTSLRMKNKALNAKNVVEFCS